MITVGALGTLTLNVMAMRRMLKARRDPSRSRVPPLGTALIALAWSATCALLLALIARTPARPPRPHE